MKFAVRSCILGICAAGASAAFATAHYVPMVRSNQVVIAAMPIPTCSPGSTCGNGKGSGIVAAMPIPTCSPGSTCGNGKGSGIIAAMPIPTCSPGSSCPHS
jgi:hypothetical protein